jgi:hypothetical protein
MSKEGAMAEQAVAADDAAESKMGDAGKGSFQQSQDAADGGEHAGEGSPEAWRVKLRDELSGKDGPKEGRKDATGPGRGRF